MAEQYYKDALQLAKKEYRACIARGKHPYLPVLDEMIPEQRITMGVDLGTIQIPAEYVVGTLTAGRTSAFARNFMPLMEAKTEFASKWERLCQAHLKEGIRDPIKVYEYMNRYYVQEGNKRVSVLKFFNAVEIRAQVIRVMPEKNDSKESKIYYEFAAFYKYSKINFIEFSKLGSYAELQRLVGKAPEEPWTDEERSALKTTYFYFRQAYNAKGGKRLRSTVGDAMLAYIKVYGYHTLRRMNANEMKKSVGKVWEEMILQQEERPIDLKLAPTDPKDAKKATTKVILDKLVGAKPLKVAFLYDKTPQTSGWTAAHEMGRNHVDRVFGSQIETVSYNDVMAKDPEKVLIQAIEEGAKVIFTTSPPMLPASLRVAVDHQDVTILNCSLNKSHRYIRTYYARMYEAKFIIGAIAGAMAGDCDVGYIADYPIFGMLASINAFARGVEMVNPTAKVYLEWSTIGGTAAATKRLTDRGIVLISSQDMARLEEQTKQTTFGLSLVNEEEGQVNLAMPVWHWGIYYEGILRSILNKTFQSEEESTDKALNYYWGMSAGVVDILTSQKNLPTGVQRLADILKASVCAGLCHPFSQPLLTQDGIPVHSDEGALLSLDQIINMDWLTENVVGTIPTYEELDTKAKVTTDVVGIERVKNEKKEKSE